MIRRSLAAAGPSGKAGAGSGAGSEYLSTTATASATASIWGNVVVVISTSFPAHDEAVDAAVHGLLDQLVASRLRPRGEVLDRPGVRGQDLDQLARHDRLDRLGGPDDRQGT